MYTFAPHNYSEQLLHSSILAPFGGLLSVGVIGLFNLGSYVVFRDNNAYQEIMVCFS